MDASMLWPLLQSLNRMLRPRQDGAGREVAEDARSREAAGALSARFEEVRKVDVTEACIYKYRQIEIQM